jgi:hypothetical protein
MKMPMADRMKNTKQSTALESSREGHSSMEERINSFPSSPIHIRISQSVFLLITLSPSLHPPPLPFFAPFFFRCIRD